jgi:uncharacterized membrane protein YqjE
MPQDQATSDLGRAVQDVAEKAQLLVREEIELAKAEMSAKVSKLIKGAVIGLIAGIFALAGLIYLLHGIALAIWKLIDGDGTSYYLGYLIVAVALFVFGGLAALIANRLIKRGTPPKPEMAIEEAQLIKQTVTSPPGNLPAASRTRR